MTDSTLVRRGERMSVVLVVLRRPVPLLSCGEIESEGKQAQEVTYCRPRSRSHSRPIPCPRRSRSEPHKSQPSRIVFQNTMGVATFVCTYTLMHHVRTYVCMQKISQTFSHCVPTGRTYVRTLYIGIDYMYMHTECYFDSTPTALSAAPNESSTTICPHGTPPEVLVPSTVVTTKGDGG